MIGNGRSLSYLSVNIDEEKDTIDDGFGNRWYRWCRCGAELQIMRPGKVQCPECYGKIDGDVERVI